MSYDEFAVAVALLLKDESAMTRASRRDLAFMEGMLTVLAESIGDELDRRDKAENPAAAEDKAMRAVN